MYNVKGDPKRFVSENYKEFRKVLNELPQSRATKEKR